MLDREPNLATNIISYLFIILFQRLREQWWWLSQDYQVQQNSKNLRYLPPFPLFCIHYLIPKYSIIWN